MSALLDLRLIVITDADLAAPRSVRDVVEIALRAGAPAIQLRDKSASPKHLLAQARELLPLVHAHHALLFINDRLDVALAASADGVHLGPDDITVAAARRVAPPQFLIGFSTDVPALAMQAERDGASYIGCGAVFGTRTKRDLAGERIGIARVDEVAKAVALPVVGIGGITAGNVHEVVSDSAAAGVAVVGAVMSAPDPDAAVRSLLAPFPPARARHGNA